MLYKNEVYAKVINEKKLFDSSNQLIVNQIFTGDFISMEGQWSNVYEGTRLGNNDFVTSSKYLINFLGERVIDASLKKFNPNTQYFVIDRAYEYPELIGKVIKNLDFDDTGVTLSLFDKMNKLRNIAYEYAPTTSINPISPSDFPTGYTIDLGVGINQYGEEIEDLTSDENMILITYGNSKYVVFILYDDIVYDSNITPNASEADIEYEIISALQFWQVDPLSSSVVNLFRQSEIPDGALEGSVQFYNRCNEYITVRVA